MNRSLRRRRSAGVIALALATLLASACSSDPDPGAAEPTGDQLDVAISTDFDQALALTADRAVFEFTHYAAARERLGLTSVRPSKAGGATDEQVYAWVEAQQRSGVPLQAVAGLDADPDAPVSSDDVVWGAGVAPYPVYTRFSDTADLNLLIDYFADHGYQRTDRPDSGVALAPQGDLVVGYEFVWVHIFPDRHLMVAVDDPDFRLPEAADSATGTPVAELARSAGPGLYVDAWVTDDCTRLPVEPEAPAPETGPADVPLASITGRALSVTVDRMTVVTEYPDAETAAADLPNRQTLVEQGAVGGPSGPIRYADVMSVSIVQDDDQLRYTVTPVGDRPFGRVTALDSDAPWEMCR